MSADDLERDEGISFLERDGGSVPCSRYGRTSSDCAPIAWRVAELIAEASGDPVSEEPLDAVMGMVVNDSDDVLYMLREYGTTDQDREWALEFSWCALCEESGHSEAEHGEPVVVREGASTRTADELLSVFIGDAQGLGVELSPWGADIERQADEALDANRSMGVAWLPEDAEGLRDALVTLADQVESDLGTLGFLVTWDDGYVIVRSYES